MNTCDCDKPKCSSELPPQVVEIIKETDPVLFHTVPFPANLGDDKTVPPDTLDHKNVLLVYEANNHAYLYSSDGIPTLISMGEINTEYLERLITEEMNARQAADLELSQRIEAIEDTSVQFDTTVTGDSSTVTLTKTTGKLNSTPNSTALPLPVASSISAGVMNPSTFNAVQQNANTIDSILDGAVAVSGLSASPTQEALRTAWETATGLTTLINRASIFDVDNQKLWYYFKNTDEWYFVNNTPEVKVAQFTNEMAGLIKGSNDPGQIFAEADGRGSVVGWDGMRHDIDNILELLHGEPVPKLYNTYGANTDGAISQQFLTQQLQGSNLVLGNENTISGGIESPYTIVGSSNTLEGSGSYSTALVFGRRNTVYTSSTAGIAVSCWPVVVGALNEIGTETDPVSSAVSLGDYTKITASRAVALGDHAKVWANDSVALGDHSISAREYEVSVGNDEHPRYLAHVATGVNPTDAVNLKQMQDYVAEHGGSTGGNDPRLTDTGATRANNLPLQVFYTTGPTDYNGDNIEVHLIQKDLATGGDATMPFMINAATPQSPTSNGAAGVMSATQATKLDRVPSVIVSDITASPLHEIDSVKLSLTEKNLDDGTETHPFVTISQATTTQAGVMTAAQVTLLQNTANAIGDINTALTTLISGGGAQ